VSGRYQDLTQFRLPPGFRGRSAATVQLWYIVQATLFRWSPQFLYGWRSFLLRLFGAKLGHGVEIRPTSRITYPWKVTIGDHCWISDDTVLYSLGEIHIGANSVISQRSYLCTGLHDHTKAGFDILTLPIVVGSECWLASDVYVAPGVSIGDGAVVGARSTVFHDLPGGMICYGTPAVPMRPRRAEEREPGFAPRALSDAPAA
jgi:putative colanic acid biosynthesis acetyltransferase WcaF